jgi:hypothetical protein
MTNLLPSSRIVSVSVNLTPSGAQAQSLSNLLLLGTSTIIDTVERYRSYGSLSAVALDFGTSAPEYLGAQVWFGQTPQPTALLIGRWVNAASTGGLRCGLLTTAQQLLSTWTAITNGSFKVSLDGAALTTVSALNFSAALSLNGVAAIIQAALAGSTVIWNATLSRFEFTSTTTGATSSVSFLTAAGAGTDISNMLAGRSTSGGAYVYSGQALETPLEAVATFDNLIGQKWYGLCIPGISSSSDHVAVAGFIEGSGNKHLYALTTSDANTLSAVATTDIGYMLKALGYNRSFTQYSSQNPYACLSAMARILTTNYNANNTVITLKFKQEPGVVYENLTLSQAQAAEAKNVNIFVQYDNGTAILEPGIQASGIWTDVITGTDWAAVTIQNSLYNVLYTSPTKIPQTDQGQQLLLTTVEAVCIQAVNNGMVAPGVWNSQGFGQLKQGDFMQKGYYVYSDSYNVQNPADRTARHAMPIQVALKLAGAIHDSAVLLNVNQ